MPTIKDVAKRAGVSIADNIKAVHQLQALKHQARVLAR